MRASKIGTHVALPDGRVGTTVFNGLCGVGIKWGLHKLDADDFVGTFGDILTPTEEARERTAQWTPDALLRNPRDWEDGRTHLDDMELVGEDFEIIEEGEV